MDHEPKCCRFCEIAQFYPTPQSPPDRSWVTTEEIREPTRREMLSGLATTTD